jgi:mRNA interferase MazF
MWLNIWFEQDWKWNDFYRPLVIIKKFNKDLLWWIPLTTMDKKWKYYFDFIDSNNKNQIVILSQLKLYSSKRLVSKKWDIWKKDFINLKEKIKSLIG